MADIRNDAHWVFEDYKQRVTTKEWKQLLLDQNDSVVFRGHVRKLVGKNLGAGVYEISKAPEKDNA